MSTVTVQGAPGADPAGGGQTSNGNPGQTVSGATQTPADNVNIATVTGGGGSGGEMVIGSQCR